MTETLLDIKKLRKATGSSSCKMTIAPNVTERLGGGGTRIAFVEEDGLVYLVPASEVQLLG